MLIFLLFSDKILGKAKAFEGVGGGGGKLLQALPGGRRSGLCLDFVLNWEECSHCFQNECKRGSEIIIGLETVNFRL